MGVNQLPIRPLSVKNVLIAKTDSICNSKTLLHQSFNNTDRKHFTPHPFKAYFAIIIQRQ
jgi:hypothetical protein